jgi:hypothetical protein
MSADFPAREPNGHPATIEDLQTRPHAPPPVLEAALDGPPPETVERVRRSPAATKLRILLGCHDVAAHARRVRGLATFGKTTGAVLLGLVLGVLAGVGVFGAVYENPERDVLRYSADNWTYTYYIKGKTATQVEYDYYLATHSNMTTALSAAVAAGLGVLAVVLFALRLLGRRPATGPPAGGVDEQIAAIVRDHPDAVREWGGPSVLREPALVREILRIEEKGGR